MLPVYFLCCLWLSRDVIGKGSFRCLFILVEVRSGFVFQLKLFWKVGAFRAFLFVAGYTIFVLLIDVTL